MLITVEEYIGMGFPEVDSRNISGCIQRSDYIIAALTEGRAERRFSLVADRLSLSSRLPDSRHISCFARWNLSTVPGIPAPAAKR